MTGTGLDVRRLHPLFAAEVYGLDLSESPSEGLVAAVRSLMDELAVLVIRDQAMNDEQHIAMSRAFGPLELPPDYRTGAPRRLRSELYDASNLDAEGKILAPDSPRREYNKANCIFHADSTFNDLPTSWSLLLSHVIPENGGTTEFIDTRVVYDDLPPETKHKIDDLSVVHDLWHSRPGGEHFKVSDTMRRLMPPVEHPLVTTLPDGRKSLCIGSHASHVSGMPKEAGRALLAELFELATQPQYIYTHAWRTGDLIIWDNRRALHRATPWNDNGQVRDMRRTTLLEGGPEICATARY